MPLLSLLPVSLFMKIDISMFQELCVITFSSIDLIFSYPICLSDRPGLRNPELVHKMQSKLKSVLSNILLPQHPEHATMFSELMTMIHDLRTLNTLHTEKFLQQFKQRYFQSSHHGKPYPALTFVRNQFDIWW